MLTWSALVLSQEMSTHRFPGLRFLAEQDAILRMCMVLLRTLATFRSDYGCEIEYEYDFPNSKQLRSQSSRSSLLLTNGQGGGKRTEGPNLKASN